MKTWIEKYAVVFVVATFLLLNACTITDPIPNNNSGAIERALHEGLETNRKLGHHHVDNAALQKALMPEVGVPNLPFGSNFDAEDRDQQFDIAVNNIPAKDFFMGLVKDTKYNITINPQITGNISLELKSITVPQAMEAIRDAYGFEYEKTSYGYKVFPRHLETKVFNVNYLDFDRGGQSQTTVGSGQITNTIQSTLTSGGVSNSQQTSAMPSGIIQTSSTTKFWDLLKQNLATIIGTEEGRSVVVNSKAGTVIVRAYPNEIRSVAQYLDNIQNILHRQVIIEAKILEVVLNAQYQSGINWKVLGIYQGFDSTGPIANIAAPGGGPISTGSNNLPTFLGIFNGEASYRGNTFSAFINLLNTQGNVNVLSSPRISTINNQKAVIKVGEDKFFVTNVSSNTNNVSGTQSNTTANITLTPFFSGISLDVTPQIDENDNITIHIHPIISQVTKDEQKFVVNGQNQDLPLAASTVRESDSVVHAKNGQVVVIGGLMQSSGESYQGSTPGLDRLPGINGLFKNHNKISLKRELIILLKPTIAGSTRDWQKQLHEAAVTVKKMNKMKNNFSYSIVPAKPKH